MIIRTLPKKVQITQGTPAIAIGQLILLELEYLSD